MKKIILLVIIVLILLPVVSLSAFDFGLLLDQTFGVEDVGTADSGVTNNADYSATIIPWFSTPLGSEHNGAKLYLSAGFTEEYANQNAVFIPELLRAELTFPIRAGMEIQAGRMRYTDPLGFIADGLFDGAKFSYTGATTGTIGVGAWYTGLLYKKSAQIAMIGNEPALYDTALDYDNFADTYFAPRLVIAALDWDNPYLTQWLRLKAAIIGRFDLSGGEAYNSQYFAVKAVVPVNVFAFNAGVCFELAQVSGQNNVSLAGELGIGWMLPTSITDRLSLTARYSGGASDGASDGSFAAFVPITTADQGNILKAKLSGLSIISLDYTARLHESLSLNVSSAYFILNGLTTYSGLPNGRDGSVLGNEFFGRIIWAPLSDLRFNFGGGIFMPSMGNADKAASPLWRVELNAIIAIF